MSTMWHPYAPNGCEDCGTRERPHHAQGLCTRCYGFARNHALIRMATEIPPVTRIRPGQPIALAMVGINPRVVAQRSARATERLREAAAYAVRRGLEWRERHPDAFTPEAVRAIYRDPAGLVVSVWADEQATVTAA